MKVTVEKKLPVVCPSCTSTLSVKSMLCEECDTEVSGKYKLPVLLQLSADEQSFLLDFVKSSGSLKEMAQKLGLSYPTVRNMLDDMIDKINNIQKK